MLYLLTPSAKVATKTVISGPTARPVGAHSPYPCAEVGAGRDLGFGVWDLGVGVECLGFRALWKEAAI
jgi:hypothetical protein